MTNKYASEDLYTFFNIRAPQERNDLYHKYGLTDNATQSMPAYSCSNNDSWGQETGTILFDSVTGKYFRANRFVDSSNTSRWFTLDQLSQTDARLSPSNISVEVYSSSCVLLRTFSYIDLTDNVTKYLVAGSNLHWRTASEMNSDGFFFEEVYAPLYLRSTGTTYITLESVGTVSGSFEFSYDGINFSSYTLGTEKQVNDGERIFFRGTRSTVQNSSNYLHFTITGTGTAAAYGNTNSLAYKNNYISTTFTQQNYSYYKLFFNCDKLTRAPLLPYTRLSTRCYESMFEGCTSLTSAPQLPATTLADRCYYGMFIGCTSLVRSPDLPAVDPAYHCYNMMFSGCTSLNEIHCKLHYDSYYDDYLTEGWIYGVAATGKFYCNTLGEWPIDDNSFYKGIPIGWTIYIEQPLCLENINSESSTIILKNVVTGSGTALSVNYEYTKEANYETAEWLQYTVGQSITLQQNEKVYFRGSRSGQSEDSYMQFELNGKLNASGNVNSLIGSSAFKDIDSLYDYGSYTFYNLFGGCQNLYSCPDLPATTLTTSCYAYMFSSCTNIENLPMLPSKTITDRSYQGMFQFCTSLEYIDYNSLPATTVGYGGYYYMFRYCTHLIEPPNLPATQISSYCYNRMFLGCSDLLWTPELPATTVAYACYDAMFEDCVSISEGPELPATTLAAFCYSLMFSGCTNLTESPELPAPITAQQCYYQMFDGCSSLNSVTCYAESITNAVDTENWLANVASTGTFNCINSSIWTPDSPNGIPLGWSANVLNVQPLSIRFETGGSADTMTVSLNAVGSYTSYNLQTSTDNLNWSSYTPGTQLTAGRSSPIYFRGYRGSHPSDPINNYLQFSIDSGTKPVYVSGNINSLLDNRPAIYSKDVDLEDYGTYVFKNLFKDCTNIRYITESYNSQYSSLTLPTKLSAGCFYGMFDGCIGLSYSEYSTSKLLPSTTLKANCYNSMFKDCILLNSLCLPATAPAANCYDNMFNGCTSLSEIHCDINTVTNINNFVFTSVSFTNWLQGVNSNGKLYCKQPIIFTRDSASGIPVGWNAYCKIDHPLLLGPNDHSVRSEYWWMTSCYTDEITQLTFKVYEPSHHSHMLESITPSNSLQIADGDTGGYIPYVKMSIDNDTLSSEDTDVYIRAYLYNNLPAMDVELPYEQYQNPRIDYIIGTYGYETGLIDTISGLPHSEYSLSYSGNYTKVTWSQNGVFNNLYCCVSKEYDGYLGWDMNDYAYISSSSNNDEYSLYNEYMDSDEVPKQNATSSSTFTITALYDEYGNLIPSSKYSGTMQIRVNGNVISLYTTGTRSEDLNVYKVSFMRAS